MLRIALGIEYDGSAYSGFQRQQSAYTVQTELEKALTHIANEPIMVKCAGRTDAGVHATGQIVHFDTQANRPEHAWTMGVNTRLPDDVAIRWAKPVSDAFHARFSATSRRYRYVILNQTLRPGIMRSGITHVYKPLDTDLMHSAAQCLVGKHDFSAFRASLCQASSPVRHVAAVSVKRIADFVFLDIEANAFLHHMVRNIMGSLIDIGCSEQSETWMRDLLQGQDRTKAAATAKPNGLYLVKVSYPDQFDIPQVSLGPLFLT